jgi:hypothetical protein
MLALLLVGDFVAFARAAADRGLEIPDWLETFGRQRGEDGSRPIPRRDDQALIDLALQFVGGHDRDPDPDDLRMLVNRVAEASADDGTVRHLVASIFAALSLRDAHMPGEALNVLTALAPSETSGYQSAVLGLHLAAAAMDLLEANSGGQGIDALDPRGQWAAISRSALPVDTEVPTRGVPLDRLIRGIAQRCAIQLTRRVGFDSEQFDQVLELGDERETVDAIYSNYLADLAEALLDRRFKDETERATTRTIVGGSRDRIAEILTRMALRARCTADWSHQYSATRLMARYRVTDVFGTLEADPAVSALELLARANDRSGTSRSARMLWVAGPQLALKTVAESTIGTADRSSGLDVLNDAELELLRIGGDLLGQNAADILATMCIDQIGRGGKNPSEIEILRVAAASSAAASDETQAALANLVLRQASSTPGVDDTFYAALAAQVRWGILPDATKLAAVEWARNVVGTDLDGSARQILAILAFDRSVPNLLSVVRDIASQRRTLSWSAVLWNTANEHGELTEDDVEVISSVALNAMRDIQDRAGRNIYSAFGGLEPAGLLTRIAVFAEAEALWAPIVAFLLDDTVQLADKSEALRLLAHHRKSMPKWASGQIAERVPSLRDSAPLGRVERSLFSQNAGLGGLGVRSLEQLMIAASFGVLSRSEILASVAELASSQLAADRSAAIDVIGLVADDVTREPMVSLTLALCSDKDVDVRADALGALARLRPVADWQQSAVNSALIRGLSSPGVLAPLRTLVGLRRVPLGSADTELRSRIATLLRSSSARVRTAAQFALEAVATESAITSEIA